MKAVEYLVVGKHAGLGLMVYEALVQGGFDGREADAVATVVEYGAQTGRTGARLSESMYNVYPSSMNRVNDSAIMSKFL